MGYLDQLFNIKGKVALLTGGGGVLASKMAEGFARAGAKVVLLGRTFEKVDTCAKALAEFSADVLAIQANVLEKSDLEKARDIILEKFGRIDILVNAAGGNVAGAVIMPDQSFFNMKMEDFQSVTDLNLNGTVLPTIVFGEVMAKQKSGSIINISSMAALQTITRVVGYSAAKAAVSNFTMWTATEFAHKFGDTVRVNAIAPGFFIAEQNRALLTNPDGSYTERGNKVIKNTPMGRFGEAEELIGAVLYLSSDTAKFVTGTVLAVDGGFSIFSGV